MSEVKQGRPSDYNQETATLICARMSEGESLRSICRDPSMPALSTVFLWIGKFPDFSEQYKVAMAARADAMFEELFDIADDGRNDYIENEDGFQKLNSEHVQRSRLRIDTRKWALSKMMPKKYGDKPNENPDDQNQDTSPVVVNINVKDASKDA